MDFILIFIAIIASVSFILSIWLFIQLNDVLVWNETVVDLLTRTFQEYYKTENIQPVAVNWGIDLVWKPGEESANGKKGFVSVFYGDDSGIDTPLKDVNEADELSSLFIPVIEKYLHEKEIRDK